MIGEIAVAVFEVPGIDIGGRVDVLRVADTTLRGRVGIGREKGQPRKPAGLVPDDQALVVAQKPGDVRDDVVVALRVRRRRRHVAVAGVVVDVPGLFVDV